MIANNKTHEQLVETFADKQSVLVPYTLRDGHLLIAGLEYGMNGGMDFCVHNCTSPSNDYAAVACSNNNQAQLHTHVSVPY